MKITNKQKAVAGNTATAFLVLVLAGFSTTQKEKENGWTEDKLKGKVKSFKEFSYKEVERFGKLEKGERTSKICAK